MSSPNRHRGSVASSSSNSPFVPSPQWLSESPGGPPSSRDSASRRSQIDRPGAPSAPTPQPDPRHVLRSPVPPPPANLHHAPPAAFSVDPGIPFLATAGPTDDGSSSGRSGRADDEGWPPAQRGKGFGTGFVSGLKRAVGSLRQSRGSRASRPRTAGEEEEDDEAYQYVYPQPQPQFRDSGYANSASQLALPQGPAPPPAPSFGRPPEMPPPLPHGALLPTYAVPPQPQPAPAPQTQPRATYSPVTLPPRPAPPPAPRTQSHASYAPVIPPLPPQPAPAPAAQAQAQPQQRTNSSHTPPSQPPLQHPQIRSPPSTPLSPISADPDYGPDYAQMDPPTPPPSDVPLTTYLSRAQRLIAHIAALPWVAPERVTADYYPEREKRSDEPKRAPKIGWAAQDYARPSFLRAGMAGLVDEGSDAGTWDEWAEEYEKGYDSEEKGGRRTPRPALITPRRGGNLDLGEEFAEAPRNTPLPTPAGTPYAGGGASLYGGFTPVSRMPTPSLYARPVSLGATPGGAGAVPPPLPQDPPGAAPWPQQPPPPPPVLGDDIPSAAPGKFFGYRPSAPNSVAGEPENHPPARAASSRASSMYTYTLPQGVAGSAGSGASARSRRSTTSARLTVPGPASYAYAPPQGVAGSASGGGGGSQTPARARRAMSAASPESIYTHPQPMPQGVARSAGSQRSAASRRSVGSVRFGPSVPDPDPASPSERGSATASGYQRARGASVASSAYAYEGSGEGGRRDPVWDSGYAESFREEDAGGVGAGGNGYGYGKYVPPPPPPLPIVGMPAVGGGGSVRSARSGRSGSGIYV